MSCMCERLKGQSDVVMKLELVNPASTEIWFTCITNCIHSQLDIVYFVYCYLSFGGSVAYW